MEKTLASSEYRVEMGRRTKQARKASGYTQAQIGELLAIPQGTYSKYEVRSCLPHQYIARFCLICHISEGWLLTGKGRGIPSLYAVD